MGGASKARSCLEVFRWHRNRAVVVCDQPSRAADLPFFFFFFSPLSKKRGHCCLSPFHYYFNSFCRGRARRTQWCPFLLPESSPLPLRHALIILLPNFPSTHRPRPRCEHRVAGSRSKPWKTRPQRVQKPWTVSFSPFFFSQPDDVHWRTVVPEDVLGIFIFLFGCQQKNMKLRL